MKNSHTRVRWFSIRPFDRKLLRKLADGMLNSKYTENTGYGFDLGDIRTHFFNGKFIQRERILRLVTNPLGEMQEVLYDDFRTTRFVVSATSLHLEIIDPPRRISELLSTIGDLLNDRVAIIPVEAGCKEWLVALKSAGCSVKVTRLVTGNIALSDMVSVKAFFTGTQDVQKEVEPFLKGHKFTPESIAGTIDFEGAIARFRLTANGSFTFTTDPSGPLLSAIRNAASSLIFQSPDE